MMNKILTLDNAGTFLKSIMQNGNNQIVMLTAKGNKFIHRGIAEGTLVYVETNSKYKKGDLILVKDTNDCYRLNDKVDNDETYCGKVFLTMNNF